MDDSSNGLSSDVGMDGSLSAVTPDATAMQTGVSAGDGGSASGQGGGAGGAGGAGTGAGGGNANIPPPPVMEENVAELSFGSEFDDIQFLSNAQVAAYLKVSARGALNRDEELHDVYKKTQRYVDRFNTMTNPEKDDQELVGELDNLQDALTTFRKETDDGDEMELHGSEVAALMNLVATDTLVEEAVSLIPSLARCPEASIDEILDLIRSTMIRIVS